MLTESQINDVEGTNGAAFYRLKIDVQAWSVIGCEFTLATNQVDFAVSAGAANENCRPLLPNYFLTASGRILMLRNETSPWSP